MDIYNLTQEFYPAWKSASQELDNNDLVLEELNSFADLDEGWSYGEGKPIDSIVINKAKRVYKIGKYFLKTVNVFPGVDGSILVVFHTQDHSIEVSVNEDLTLNVVIEKGIGFDFQVIKEKDNIELKSIENILSNYKQSEWNILGSFITDTIVEKRKDFEVQHFLIPQTGAESPSLNINAFYRRQKQFMTTS